MIRVVYPQATPSQQHTVERRIVKECPVRLSALPALILHTISPRLRLNALPLPVKRRADARICRRAEGRESLIDRTFARCNLSRVGFVYLSRPRHCTDLPGALFYGAMLTTSFEARISRALYRSASWLCKRERRGFVYVLYVQSFPSPAACPIALVTVA